MTNLELKLGYEEFENICIEQSKNIGQIIGKDTFEILDADPGNRNYMKVSGTHEIKELQEYPFYCMLMSSRHDDSLAKTIQKYLWDLNQLTNKHVLLLIFSKPENIPQKFADYWIKKMGKKNYDDFIANWIEENVYEILNESGIPYKMLPCLTFTTDLKDIENKNAYVIPLPSGAQEDEVFDFIKNEIMDKLEACSVKSNAQDRLNDLKDALLPLIIKQKFTDFENFYKEHKDIIDKIFDTAFKMFSPTGAASSILSFGNKMIVMLTPK
jgi:hypothetical protein